MAEFLQSRFKDAQTEFTPADALTDINRALEARGYKEGDRVHSHSPIGELLSSRALFTAMLEQEEGVAA